jgi:hypothetical protein
MLDVRFGSLAATRLMATLGGKRTPQISRRVGGELGGAPRTIVDSAALPPCFVLHNHQRLEGLALVFFARATIPGRLLPRANDHRSRSQLLFGGRLKVASLAP